MDSGHNNETSKSTFVEEVLSIQPGIQRARPHIERTEDPMIFTQWDRDLYFTKWWPLIYVLGASFGTIHLISWNSTFLTTPPPPPFERWLWRSSALTSVIMSIIYMQFKIVSLRWDGPLTIVRVSVPILYIISHVVMMAEVFAALRAMPRNTYDTYEIWNYWPFFSLMCYKTVIGLLWQ